MISSSRQLLNFIQKLVFHPRKKLLFDSCEETALRLITYRVNAPKLNWRDIISKMIEVGSICPIFVTVNIAKLPIVTADAFSIAKITKDFSSILNIEQNVMTSHTTLWPTYKMT